MSTPADVARRLRGVIAATVTPFVEADLRVDLEGISFNARRLAELGVEVFVVNGSIGEAASMSAAERKTVIERTVDALPASATVIAGCSHADPAEVLRLGRESIASGAAAVLVQPPYQFKLRADECVDFFAWLDRELGRPLVLYDNPATARGELDADVIDRVSRLGSFAGLKEAGSDVVRFVEIIDRFGGRFPVVAAAEDPLLFMLVAGAPACMTATAAFAPDVLARVMDAVNSSDLGRARSEFARVRAFRRLFAARSRIGEPAYLPFTKAAVELTGGRAGPPRPPLRPVEVAERDALARVLSAEMGLELVVA